MPTPTNTCTAEDAYVVLVGRHTWQARCASCGWSDWSTVEDEMVEAADAHNNGDETLVEDATTDYTFSTYNVNVEGARPGLTHEGVIRAATLAEAAKDYADVLADAGQLVTRIEAVANPDRGRANLTAWTV